MILGPDTQQLIKMGFLLPDKYWGVPIDMSGISKSGGDFSTSEMYERYNSPELYLGVINNWLKFTPGTLTLCFCVNIQHCLQTAKVFNQNGVTAKFISSEPPKPKVPKSDNKADWTKYEIKTKEYEAYKSGYSLYSGNRAQIIQDWKDRKFLVLINAGILTSGFNHKPIETIIINRATSSDNLFLQMIGRGSRPNPNKDHFNILDFGSNAERLGHYRAPREYSLSHEESKGGGIPAYKECKGIDCGCLVLASAMICPYCGYVFPKSQKQKEVELVEQTFHGKQYKEAIKEFQTVEDIEMLARVKSYKKAWVFRTIFFKLGEDVFKEYMRSKEYKWPYIYRLLDGYK
jgi:superfamily II DNA or RNA helicase